MVKFWKIHGNFWELFEKLLWPKIPDTEIFRKFVIWNVFECKRTYYLKEKQKIENIC